MTLRQRIKARERPPLTTQLSTERSRVSALLVLLGLLSVNLAGCTVVKGIFKAGVWVGVLGVCAVLALLVYGVSKLGRRS
jgi:hypothetical protein